MKTIEVLLFAVSWNGLPTSMRNVDFSWTASAENWRDFTWAELS